MEFGVCHSPIRASLIAQLVKNLPAMQKTLVQFLGQETPWRRDRLPTPVFLGFPCGSAGKKSTCNIGDLDSIPGLRRSPEEWKGYPLQYSVLENSTDCIVNGIAKSWTRMSNFHFSLSPSWYKMYSLTWKLWTLSFRTFMEVPIYIYWSNHWSLVINSISSPLLHGG